MVRMHLECCEKDMGLCGGVILEGDGMSTVELSSSSEVLKVNWHHIDLQYD